MADVGGRVDIVNRCGDVKLPGHCAHLASAGSSKLHSSPQETQNKSLSPGARGKSSHGTTHVRSCLAAKSLCRCVLLPQDDRRKNTRSANGNPRHTLLGNYWESFRATAPGPCSGRLPAGLAPYPARCEAHRAYSRPIIALLYSLGIIIRWYKIAVKQSTALTEITLRGMFSLVGTSGKRRRQMAILYLLLGLVAGIFSGLIGIGGGVIIVPALIYLFRFEQHLAQGTTLALLVPPIGILAAWTYYKQGYVDLKVAALVALGFFLGGLVGARIAVGLPQHILKKIFGVALLYISLNLILSR
ncbi:MAG: sulfite exporter TauE/SafE family protein [Armatimonadota bacterium]|nr:sulfite exporter TauE/SafE family protein [Armatimonadota bacterium]